MALSISEYWSKVSYPCLSHPVPDKAYPFRPRCGIRLWSTIYGSNTLQGSRRETKDQRGDQPLRSRERGRPSSSGRGAAGRAGNQSLMFPLCVQRVLNGPIARPLRFKSRLSPTIVSAREKESSVGRRGGLRYVDEECYISGISRPLRWKHLFVDLDNLIGGTINERAPCACLRAKRVYRVGLHLMT